MGDAVGVGEGGTAVVWRAGKRSASISVASSVGLGTDSSVEVIGCCAAAGTVGVVVLVASAGATAEGVTEGVTVGRGCSAGAKVDPGELIMGNKTTEVAPTPRVPASDNGTAGACISFWMAASSARYVGVCGG